MIVLGGGASGCMCALATDCDDVCIIDRQNKIGKKILATGNGRCNITNQSCTRDKYNVDIEKYLSRLSPADTLAFFRNLGLECSFDSEGRCYPLSNSAKSVVSVLENGITKKGVRVRLEEEIQKVEKCGQNYLVKTDKNEYACEKLVIATGGNSAHAILDNLQVPHSHFMPSLCSLKADVSRSLANVRVSSVKVTATSSSGKKQVENGEVLFRENGLSGIVIFNLSSIFAREGVYKGKIEIDLLPNISESALFEMLARRRSLALPVNKFFDGLFVQELGWEILSRSHVNENGLTTQMTDDEIRRLAREIKQLGFTVKGCGENNQVCSGGVNLAALDDNLQHKSQKNLYFCGEVCDVDGLCGGFNLQWAWTSGYIVGKAIR